MKHKLFITLGVLVLTLSAFGIASAHAKLDHCTPAVGSTVATAPAQVMCVYSEEIDTKQSTMSIWNASGAQVDKKDAHVDLNDPDHKTLIVSLDPAQAQNGLYTVKWHAVTPDDNGVSEGTWQFIIGSASATPFPPTEIAQGETPAATAATGSTATAPAGAVSTATTAAPAATSAATPTTAPPSTAPTTGGGISIAYVLVLLLGVIIVLGGATWALRRR